MCPLINNIKILFQMRKFPWSIYIYETNQVGLVAAAEFSSLESSNI